MWLAGAGRRAGAEGSRGDEFYRLRARARIRGAARLAIVCALAVVSWHVANVAAAQAAAATSEPDARSIARRHFEAGLAHYGEHRYREAIREFELSVAAVPNADVWFDIARAHEQLGELEPAIEAYQRYLRDRVDASDAPALRRQITALQARSDAERAARAARAAPTVGAIAVDAAQRGVRVELDGRDLGPTPLERVVPVEAGAHRIAASKPGLAPFVARVDVQPGSVSAAYVRLIPIDLREPSRPPGAATCALAGAGAIALLAGGVLAVAAGSARDAQHVDDADDLAGAARVGFGVALGSAAGAMLAYVIERSMDAPSSSLTLSKSR